MTTTTAQEVRVKDNRILLPVDSDVSKHYLDDTLIPGLNNVVTSTRNLTCTTPSSPAVHINCEETATVLSHATSPNQTASTIDSGCPTASYLTFRNLFSAKLAASRGFVTVIKPKHLHLSRGDIVVPLQQLIQDTGLYSFVVELAAKGGVLPTSSELEVAMAAQANFNL